MLAVQKKWFQIYTQPNCEKSLYQKLVQLGIEAFLPVRKVQKQWSDRVKTIEEPAFKSYIFAKLFSEEMRMIEKLSEFGFFVSYGNNAKNSQRVSERLFPNITDQHISTIAEVLAAFPEAELQQKQFKKGERIVLNNGNLKGYQGVIVESPKGKKVAVELIGLNQSLLMTIPQTMLQYAA